MLAFNITQFFPSLNYQLLQLILDKASLNPRISSLFSDYLISRKTQYLQNNFSSSVFNIDVSIEQDSVLSSVLSALYLSPIFYIFEKRIKNLKIPVLLISFIDDGLFVLQEKSFKKSNFDLFCSYNVIFSLLEQFSLVVK